ncbi:MAG: pilus (MSHA type) biogenesis protein MshL [Planctomycetes bacterium RIFCSPHIGHO2_12_FULL_52_36]|nr:MAG: pilus (MSHA type) biogenesis protein MshL [Planctomycetes bacterium RIFCSPHIGHO2_02_FULL_52_58]OHB93255.1 MAG: pilus (MSHA type) biogenesis protein MshL [Planctomycetes bacterium RIFCSPHIGHO2_12_FULL_52_36]
MSIVGRSVLSGKTLPVAVFFLAIIVVGCVPAAKKLPTDSVTSPSLTDLPKKKRLEELPVLQLEEKVKKPDPPRVYSLFVRDADIRDVLQGFSKEGKVNIIVDPDVSGKVTLDLKDVTMAQAMDALLSPMGLEYRVDSGFIRVSKPKAITRMFRLNYILTKRSGERFLSTSVGSAATGGTLTAGKSEVKGTDTQDIFQEIEMSLVAIGLKSAGMLGAQGSGGAGAALSIITTLPPGIKGLFSINRQAGIILVTAFPEVIAKVAELLEAVEGTIQRQVLIQAKIVEVFLNDEFRYGINFDMLFGGAYKTGNRRPPAAAIGQSMDTNRKLLPEIARDIKTVAGFFQFTLRTGDIEPIVEALSIQGDVNVISSPKISTLNNQTAIIRVGQQKTFFSVSTTVTSGTGTATTSSNVEENTITVGVTMDVTPQISQDGFITMNIHPSVTEQVGETTVSTPTASATAPILDVRETDTVIRVKDGETIAIGGLMQDKKNLNENQVPVLGKIPGLGFLFKEVDNKKSKRDMVIFLTPTIVAGERVEDLATEDIQRLKLTERR